MTKDTEIGVGVFGCGAMGAELALAVGPAGIKNARVQAIFDQDLATARALASRISGDVPVFGRMDDFLAVDSVDLVVECASQAAVRAHGRSILQAGKSLLMMSSGALLDPATYEGMIAAAEESGSEIIVPSGAVGGIDALRAARALLDSVEIVSTKKPLALKGARGFAEWDSRAIDAPTVIFEGSAAEAVELFPANVNVAATISLAGIGPTRTRVKVVADPDSPGNVHEIRASGSAGELSFRFVNRPHPSNPKTSHLAVLAAIETLRNYCESGPRIGT